MLLNINAGSNCFHCFPVCRESNSVTGWKGKDYIKCSGVNCSLSHWAGKYLTVLIVPVAHAPWFSSNQQYCLEGVISVIRPDHASVHFVEPSESVEIVIWDETEMNAPRMEHSMALCGHSG